MVVLNVIVREYALIVYQDIIKIKKVCVYVCQTLIILLYFYISRMENAIILALKEH